MVCHSSAEQSCGSPNILDSESHAGYNIDYIGDLAIECFILNVFPVCCSLGGLL